MGNETTGIKTSVTEELGIHTFFSGYYNEYLVCNGTDFNIVVIDSSNKRVTVLPDIHRTGKVVITSRKINGARETRTPTGMVEIKLPTTTHEIEKSIIERGYVHHIDTNLIIATVEVGRTMVHPDAKANYSELLKVVTAAIAGRDCSAIYFSLNDPLARSSEVFCHLDGHTFRIPCTNVKSPDKLATFTIVLNDGGSSKTHEYLVVEDLFTLRTFTVPAFGKLLSLGITAAEALDHYIREREVAQSELDADTSKRLCEIRKESDRRYQLEKERTDNQITELKNSVMEFKLTNESLKQANADLKADVASKQRLLDEWEAVRNHEEQERKREYERRGYEYKYGEQYHKTRREEIKNNGEMSKIWINVAVAVVSVIATIAAKEFVKSKA
jgi:hypothetical protein